MINGVDYIGFFVTFGGGFIIGTFVGMALYAYMSEGKDDK